MLADFLALSAALVLAFIGGQDPWEYVGWGLLALPVCLIVFGGYGLYDRDIKRVKHGAVDDLPGVMQALALACLLAVLYYQAISSGTVDFDRILLFGTIALIITPILRTAARMAIKRRLGPERILLVGEDETTARLVDTLIAHPEHGVKPVGLLSASDSSAMTNGDGRSARHALPRLGAVIDANVRDVVASHRVDRIMISHGQMSDEELVSFVHLALQLGVKVSLVPQRFVAMGPSAALDSIGGLTVLSLRPPVLGRASRTIKRGIDVIGSLLLLVWCAPLLVLIACSIKLDSRGSVLFHQERVGRAGKRFRLVKFRTMVEGADRLVDELLVDSRDPSWLLLDHDPRVTRIGRLLRRTSLDELPQAWNVLRGEMSLVGPRPLVESEDRKIVGWGRCRVDLAPGMTGLWQVMGRTTIPFKEMIALDCMYVTNWSLWLDLNLLMSTVPVLLSRRGAN